MRRHDFTPAALDAMTSGRRPDPAVAGLTFVNAPSGRKSWSFRRRLPGSKKILSLTRDYPAVSIADAREWATALNEKIERGIDPREEARAQQAHLAMTIEAAHRLYMEVLRRGDRKKLKPRTISDKQVIFDRDIKPRLGDRLLYDLTDDQCWEAVYDKAEASKDRANKMASELNCFLRWCSGREGRMAGIEPLTHPAPTLTSTWFSTGPKANTRFLSDQEIKWLLQALVAENATYRRGFLLLLLTAARRNELHGAPSSEFADSIWTLPSDRSKNGDINATPTAIQTLQGARFQDLSGARPPLAPKWSGNWTVDYSLPVTDGLTLKLTNTLFYKSGVFLNPNNDPFTRQAGYVREDLTIALASDNGWELSVIGKNLTDHVIRSFGAALPTSLGTYLYITEPPRNISLQLKYGF